MLAVHDDLYSKEKKVFTTDRFCTPIIIADAFEILFSDPIARDKHNSIKLRNGTVTFVSIKGGLYGITCKHVIDVLECKQKSSKEKYNPEFPRGMLEPILENIYVPHGNDFLPIYSRFYSVPGDKFTSDGMDIAIAKLDPQLLPMLGKFALPASTATRPESLDIRGLCGIATGHPENNRQVYEHDKLINKLQIPMLHILANLSCFDARRVGLFGELDDNSSLSIDNLSGMSGGPIFWTHDDDWGFAGIIFKGRDLIGSEKSQSESSFSGSTIWIEGEVVSVAKLEYWASLVPNNVVKQTLNPLIKITPI